MHGASWPAVHPRVGWRAFPCSSRTSSRSKASAPPTARRSSRTTCPEHSDWEVERIEAAGGIILGKTNTPEFGAGANTFNEVFGITRNPWDLRLTCGGSSGGAAVALATGMAWLADGSDLGGSLRTPASFCGVVGLRPSPGRVPHGPGTLPFGTLSVNGPMARDVRDVALFLDVLAGFDPRDPLSHEAALGIDLR